MAKPLMGVWETSGLHELFLRWVGRKHYRQGHGCVGSQLPHGRWPSSHTGHHQWHSTCSWRAWALVPSLPFPLFCHGKELDFDFGGGGRRAISGCEVISSTFAWKCCRELFADYRKRDTSGRGAYQNTLQSSSLAANIILTSFLGALQRIQICLEGRFDRTCVMDSVESFQGAIKRGKGGQTFLAFFPFYLGNWKSYLWNSEATINSWRETRCSKHFTPDKNCSKFCSLQTKSEQMPNQSSK